MDGVIKRVDRRLVVLRAVKLRFTKDYLKSDSSITSETKSFVFHRSHSLSHVEFDELNLERLQQFIDQGRLIVNPSAPLTLRDLYAAGVVGRMDTGVKLLAKVLVIIFPSIALCKRLLSQGKDSLRTVVHLEVSDASESAIECVERLGGTVTCIHLNRLALRAMLKPYRFELYPYRARPTPGKMDRYLDYSRRGYLSPEVQIRNLKLFGSVTSEKRYREEHALFMNSRRLQNQIVSNMKKASVQQLNDLKSLFDDA